jgi:HK97 family phage major capsid protein
MSEDVKTLVSDMGTAFEEFKKSYDQKLENVEKGINDTALDAKIAGIEAKLDQYEDVNQRIVASQKTQESIKDQMDRMETVMRRPNSGFTAKQIDEGSKAFDNYCRKGMEGITADEKKALTVSNDTTGGYLAPPEYIRELIKTITEISPIRSISRVRNTGQRSIQIPKRTGTFAAQWVSESGTRSETTGWQVGLEEIPAHEMYALVDISEQDLEDSVFNLEAEMQSEFTEQFAKAEGTAFVSGNAVGKPEGILTNSDVGETNSGAGAALTGDGLIALVHSIKCDYSRMCSKQVCHLLEICQLLS